MADWIARLIVATALIFSSGIVILSMLLGSLAVFFTLGLVSAIAQTVPQSSSQPIPPAGDETI